jgi:hypothetical protein
MTIWNILWTFGIIYGRLVYVVCGHLLYFLPIWNVWTKKNLATLLPGSKFQSVLPLLAAASPALNRGWQGGSQMSTETTAQLCPPVSAVTWDRCYDFKNIFAKKIGERNGVFDSKQS